MRRLKIALAALFVAVTVYGVEAAPGVLTFTQKDGKTFKGKLVGDEWFGWIEDTQQHIIVFNKKSGFYEFAKIVDDANSSIWDLVPTGIKVPGDLFDLNVSFSQKMLKIPKIDRKRLFDIWRHKREEAAKRMHR